GMTFADIDAIVIGKAPDALEAVMMPELSLADALGAVGKPIHRVHTAGSVGASTAITGATLVESGRYERVLVVCYEKQSEGNATWALSGGRSGGQGAGGTFAPWIRSYISRSGAPEHIGWKIAVKDRLNALKNPHAHLRIDDISIEKVKESPMLWDPLHFLESCPSSDGAAAVVLASEDVARRSPRPPAWVVAHAKRTEFSSFPGRDTVRPVAGVDCAEALYAKAGITDPLRQIDCAELYVPFSWYEPMWLEGHLITPEGEGWKLTDAGETELNGSFPVNPSGGVLSSNPIGASGLIRCLEAANQVRGTAGAYQVDGAQVALGHAYGGAAQYFAMWIVSSELNPEFR
ncbi:MAG TPA: thiolase domain-containing protein, partial [Acidimicrobiia bacterium]|nr:thiolase domain-containing protein [Acidimicrobiia bacterium]